MVIGLIKMVEFNKVSNFVKERDLIKRIKFFKKINFIKVINFIMLVNLINLVDSIRFRNKFHQRYEQIHLVEFDLGDFNLIIQIILTGNL